MFRHVVLMTWKDETTPEQIQGVINGLGMLPTYISSIRSYTFGHDLKTQPGNADFALVADFDDEDAYREYSTHPAHVKLISDAIRPILANRVAVQYETGPTASAA